MQRWSDAWNEQETKREEERHNPSGFSSLEESESCYRRLSRGSNVCPNQKQRTTEDGRLEGGKSSVKKRAPTQTIGAVVTLIAPPGIEVTRSAAELSQDRARF